MLDYVDPGFNKDFTRHCVLLLQLEEHQFAYAIYEKRTGRLQVLKTVSVTGNTGYISRLKISLTNEDLLNLPFDEVKVSIANAPFTFIPRSLYEEQLNTKYLSLTAPVGAGDEVMVNNIRSIFIKNIFSVEREEISYLKEVFDHPKFYHVSSALLEHVLRNKDQLASQQLIIDIKQNLMHLVFFEKGEFKLLNQFRFTTKDDFLYYVLMIADQFHIDRNTCDVKLSGEVMPDSMLFSEIWKYFMQVTFLQVNENLILPGELIDRPLYIFNTLFSLDLCE